MITIDFKGIELKLRPFEGSAQVFDHVRKIWVSLTPEEHVRQHILHYLSAKLHYPAALIAVEKQVLLGGLAKRFDIVIYNREHNPWMLIECKAPEVDITDATLQQLLQYQHSMQCRYWVLTNGHQTFCADARNIQQITWLKELPAYNS